MITVLDGREQQGGGVAARCSTAASSPCASRRVPWSLLGVRRDQLLGSPGSVFEVLHGLLRKGEKHRAADFSATLFGDVVLAFDTAAAERTAEILTELERGGR